MFGGRPVNGIRIKNAYDEHLKDLYNELADISFDMGNIAHRIYVKNFVIQMFPDGADKNLEIEEVDNLRKKLLRQVAFYDSKRHEIIDYLEINKGKYNCEWAHPVTSHQRIENYVSNILVKR